MVGQKPQVLGNGKLLRRVFCGAQPCLHIQEDRCRRPSHAPETRAAKPSEADMLKPKNCVIT